MDYSWWMITLSILVNLNFYITGALIPNSWFINIVYTACMWRKIELTISPFIFDSSSPSRMSSSQPRLARCSFLVWRDRMNYIHELVRNVEKMDRTRPASSTVSLTIYRVTTTFFSCPILRTRPIACASTEGFHWGSKIWTRLALARLRLQ